jgi:hypothetical protein
MFNNHEEHNRKTPARVHPAGIASDTRSARMVGRLRRRVKFWRRQG